VEEIRQTGGDETDAKGQIRVDQTSAEISYANFALVGTNPEEFILSFGVRTGEEATIKVAGKVIMSPKNAKRFAAALTQSLRIYEERFGTVDASFVAPKDKPRK
jgi:hypothetical protein